VPDFSLINNTIKSEQRREMGPNEKAWVMVWERVRSMKCLRRLYVEFEVPGVWRGVWGREQNERGAVESLSGIEVEEFVLGLPWEREDGRGMGNEEVGVERKGGIEILRVNGGSERARPRSNSFASEGAMIWRREKCFRLEL
jgi:hypothetical protein